MGLHLGGNPAGGSRAVEGLVELTGSSIFDYVHPGDHLEVADQLGLKAPLGPGHPQRPKASLLGPSASSSGLSVGPQSDLLSSSRAAERDKGLERSFFVRLKSTLTKRGLHIKTSGYKVIHITGRLRSRRPSYPHAVLGRVLGLVALAHTLPPSTLSEVRIECHMFVFRVNMDLQIVITDYMDFCPSELVGKSCYRFIHGEDVEGIQQSHLDCTWPQEGRNGDC
ncbi:hypothetical protein E2320_000839 [Naja naja]|nr:hypothetical protein E2320_000839 [Naja naja]